MLNNVLDRKVALIAVATSGIGRATAQLFAASRALRIRAGAGGRSDLSTIVTGAALLVDGGNTAQ